MKPAHVDVQLRRFEELTVDSLVTELDDDESVELSELRLALGERGHAARSSLEDAAALVSLSATRDAHPMPTSLRRKLQQSAFESVERGRGPHVEAPSTTTGANVVAVGELPPRASTSRWPLWAAAAVVLVGLGYAGISTRSTPTGTASEAVRDTTATLRVLGDGTDLRLRLRDVPASRGFSEGLHLFVRRDDVAGADWRWVAALPRDPGSPAGPAPELEVELRADPPVHLPASFVVGRRRADGGPELDTSSWRGSVTSPAHPVP